MLIARMFLHPYGARKNTTQLAKYPRVLYVKPSNKVYIFTSTSANNCEIFIKFSEKCARSDWSEPVHYISIKHAPYATRVHYRDTDAVT